MSLVPRYVFKEVVKEKFVSFIDDCHAYNKNSIEVIEQDEDDDGSAKAKDINFEPKLNGDILSETVILLSLGPGT